MFLPPLQREVSLPMRRNHLRRKVSLPMRRNHRSNLRRHFVPLLKGSVYNFLSSVYNPVTNIRIRSTAPELGLQLSNKASCSGSYPYWCTGCARADFCCDEPCSSLSCDDVDDHCVDNTVTDTNSSPSPARTRKPRSTPRSKRPSKPSSETLRTVLERFVNCILSFSSVNNPVTIIRIHSTAPELELQVGNKVGCSGSYPYRCTGCGKDDACCDEPCSSLTCDDVEDHCVDNTVTDTNSYPSPAKTKEPSKPY